MSNKLDLAIKKALINKINLADVMPLTVNVSSEMTIDFTISEHQNQLTLIATYEQTPKCIQHSYKNVTITYYSWNDGLSEDVTDEITIHYETKRTINKTDDLTPVIKEMIQEIINTKAKHSR